MKALLATVAVLLFAVSAFGQSATLATPETPPTRTSLQVGAVTENQNDPNIGGDVARATVTIWKMAGSVHVQGEDLTIQMVGAEVAGLETARTNVATNETGTNARKQNFRILTYLKANCATFQTPCPAQVSTATIVP